MLMHDPILPTQIYRYSVALDTPNEFATSFAELSLSDINCLANEIIFSLITRGRPQILPRARADANPALVLSQLVSRSNFAKFHIFCPILITITPIHFSPFSGIRISKLMEVIMDQKILKKANLISQGDPDIQQNILAWNFQNLKNAAEKGKNLSIGEQIKFMRGRACELRSGTRRYFGNNGGHLAKDVFNKNLYYSGKIKLLRIHYTDQAGNEEDPEKGRSEIAAFTSIKDVEAACIFNLDMEVFLQELSKMERTILLKKLEGFSINEIVERVNLSRYVVSSKLKNIGRRYLKYCEISVGARFGLA